VYHQPCEGEKTVFFSCIVFYHQSPDSGERRYKART
jgi:hypothetical protein